MANSSERIEQAIVDALQPTLQNKLCQFAPENRGDFLKLVKQAVPVGRESILHYDNKGIATSLDIPSLKVHLDSNCESCFEP